MKWLLMTVVMAFAGCVQATPGGSSQPPLVDEARPLCWEGQLVIPEGAEVDPGWVCPKPPSDDLTRR